MGIEEKLNSLGNDVRTILIDVAMEKTIRPKDYIQGRRYLKDDVVPTIVSRLQNDGMDLNASGGPYPFKELLYNSINKEPLKRTYYGMFNSESLPREIIQELTPWMAVYFYAGFWTKKSTRLLYKKFLDNNIKNKNIYKIVYDCVMEGMKTMKKIHNQEYEKGNYKYFIKTVPHEKEIKAMLSPPTEPNYSKQKTFFQQWSA